MMICMAGLEHSLASIDLREKLSFTKAQTVQMDEKIRAIPGISGCVLISTCNRTELYITCEQPQNPGQILCSAAGTDYGPYRDAFVVRTGEEAICHLMEVAAGLRSRIFGEDQIISQVKGAIALAREAGAANSTLETLFRSAISAGKEIRTDIRLTALPTSAASMAVDRLKADLGDLTGKKALVIGNGEMGRLSAALLYQAGAQVSMTLRTYRHGETIVPAGCGVVAYDDRLTHMEGTDILVSATTSPHYTVTADQLAGLSCPPARIVDLAIPRDIQPEAALIPGIRLYNVDDLGNFSESRQVPEEVSEILRAHLNNFHRWLNYKDCMSTLDTLKQAITERLTSTMDAADPDTLETAVSKTVDLMVGGLAERVDADLLGKCEQKIRSHSR